MQNQYYLYIALLFIALTSCNGKNKKKIVPDFTKNTMDETINPGDNFYNYANGNWLLNNVIPEDKSRYGSFEIVTEKAKKDIKVLIEDIVDRTYNHKKPEQRISTLYNSGMNLNRLNTEGISPLIPYLEIVNQIKKKEDIDDAIIKLFKNSIDVLFSLNGKIDLRNSETITPYLKAKGLGLPGKEYYLSDEEKIVDIRYDYVNHIKKMFMLFGYSNNIAEQKACRVMSIETKLAESTLSITSKGDPYIMYNPTSQGDFKVLLSNFDVDKLFKTINFKYKGDITVSQPTFFKDLNTLLEKGNIESWKDFLRWKIININVIYLSEDLVKEDFMFYTKRLSGNQKIQPRWKYITSLVSLYLGEDVARLYVKKHFPARAKIQLQELVANIKETYRRQIVISAWMSDKTKKRSLEKLRTIDVKIGYPDEWKDYSDMELSSDSSFLENILSIKKFIKAKNIRNFGNNFNKKTWPIASQIVNAYYNQNRNEIVFPAAILQAPFFYLDGSDAANYGAIGTIIAHEFSHAFDRESKLYNKEGKRFNWWAKEEIKYFNTFAKKIEEHYSNFCVIDDLHVNGQQTLKQNIADIHGLSLAWKAVNMVWKINGHPKKKGNFTPEQEFFISYARIWAENIRVREEVKCTRDNSHALRRFRVLGPLPFIQGWYNAFNVTPKDSMYLSPEKRIILF